MREFSGMLLRDPKYRYAPQLMIDAADELARLRVDAEKMRAFCRDALHEFWEGDGEMQDMGKRHGLLIEVEVTEPCGEACSCAEYGADFPTECYRFAPFLR